MKHEDCAIWIQAAMEELLGLETEAFWRHTIKTTSCGGGKPISKSEYLFTVRANGWKVFDFPLNFTDDDSIDIKRKKDNPSDEPREIRKILDRLYSMYYHEVKGYDFEGYGICGCHADDVSSETCQICNNCLDCCTCEKGEDKNARYCDMCAEDVSWIVGVNDIYGDELELCVDCTNDHIGDGNIKKKCSHCNKKIATKYEKENGFICDSCAMGL